jgi:hypothetical protein
MKGRNELETTSQNTFRFRFRHYRRPDLMPVIIRAYAVFFIFAALSSRHRKGRLKLFFQTAFIRPA